MLGGLLVFLFLGALVDSVSSLKFNFTDSPQCDQVLISFLGNNKTKDVPDSLTIVPLNSTPIVVPIPNPALVSSGIAITFLPLPEGSNFVASLDDATGDNVIDVSDLIRILPSENNRTDCLPPPNAIQERRFRVESPATQCEPLTITYNTTIIKEAPLVRLLSPQGPAFYLDGLSDNATSGTATYMMNFPRGEEFILIIDDGGGIRETSSLLTVQGDASSSRQCLARKKTENKTDKNKNNDDDDDGPSASRAVIIGSASGGAAVLLIGACMGIFIWRDRRQRRQRRVGGDVFTSLEKNDPPGPPPAAPPTRPRRPSRGLSTLNPLYTTGFLSPTLSAGDRVSATDSMGSWGRFDGDRKTGSPLSPSQVMARSPQARSVDNASIQSWDIEGMLDLATNMKRSESTTTGRVGNGSPNRQTPEVIGIGTIVAAEPTIARPQPAAVGISVRPERHMRSNLDVPADLNSRTFSNYSLSNPFDGPSGPTSLRASVVDNRVSGFDGDEGNVVVNPFGQDALNTRRGRGVGSGASYDYPSRGTLPTTQGIDRRDSGGSQSSRRVVGLPSSPRSNPGGLRVVPLDTSPRSSRTGSSAWYGIAS